VRWLKGSWGERGASSVPHHVDGAAVGHGIGAHPGVELLRQGGRGHGGAGRACAHNHTHTHTRTCSTPHKPSRRRAQSDAGQQGARGSVCVCMAGHPIGSFAVQLWGDEPAPEALSVGCACSATEACGYEGCEDGCHFVPSACAGTGAGAPSSSMDPRPTLARPSVHTTTCGPKVKFRIQDHSRFAQGYNEWKGPSGWNPLPQWRESMTGRA
jgi:hypothetical protein